MNPLTAKQAEELAHALDLDVGEAGVCPLCLSFVSFALEQGDEREIRRTTARIARDLWHDGLEGPVRTALAQARQRGVPTAEEAIAEVERQGPRARVVKAIVRRLAAQLSSRMSAHVKGEGNGRLTVGQPP